MLELAEDEQEDFIKSYKSKIFANLKSEKQPQFVILIGASGVGKSTLAKKHENFAVIGPDDIFADYWEAIGADARGFVYDKEVGLFASKVVNALLKEAALRNYNIVYDASVSKNTQNLMNRFGNELGYDVQLKAIVGDDMRSQLNVVKRKLNFDQRVNQYKAGKVPEYPSGDNPMQVDMEISARSSLLILDFLNDAEENGLDFEVYEPGKSSPAFDTRKGRQTFEQYLGEYVEKLPDTSVYEEECGKLIKKARQQGNENLEMQLQEFRRREFAAKR